MKKIFAILIVCVLIVSCKKELPLVELNSNKKTIAYKINEQPNQIWTISPDLKPDRLEVECDEKGSVVKFISDVDSIQFNVKLKDTIQFNVLHDNKTALTEIVGIPKNVHFSDAYVKKHKGKFRVEVPEVHELANIMVAISKIGKLDSNMVDMTTQYHKKVLNHFDKFKDHPAIDTINKHIVKVFDNDSYWYYYALKMNACGYEFDKNNNIIEDGIITKMGFNNEEDPFVRNKDLFTDFSKKSGFRAFYQDNKPYYDSLVSTYKKLNPIDKMQLWLEKKFGFTYGNYLVTFSPLVGGAHSTQKYEDNGFNQTVMYVCSSDFLDKYNDNVNEMINSRVVFTEIDHNFVNPTSDRYVDEINNVVKPREKWVNTEANGTSAYSIPYAVFNEYMTFAFFSLYCIDNFPQEDVEVFLPRMNKMMSKRRGFKKFEEFNKHLVSVYKSKPEITVDEIYTEMLDWMRKQ